MSKERGHKPGASLLHHWLFLSCFTPLSRLNLLQGSRGFHIVIYKLQADAP